MSRGRSQRVMVTRVGGPAGEAVAPSDVVVEEPLEIRLGDRLVATTMRTPGDDFELAAGFCHNEGHLDGTSVREVRYCATAAAVDTHFNVVTVEPTSSPPARPARLGTTSSSCGVCGSQQLDELVARMGMASAPTVPFDTSVLDGLGVRVREDQSLFGATGGSHAAAEFSLTDGKVCVVREDIGRHNAVDKVAGRLLLAGRLPASGSGLWVSGRASFEIVQKAWAAGFPLVVSVSSPSSLAVSVASRAGMGLVGFAREDGATIFTWPEGWHRT